MRPTSFVITAALITAFCIVPAAPTSAIAATTPCAAGTPVPGDYDGDGGADLLVGTDPADKDGHSLVQEGNVRVSPSRGGAPYWLKMPTHYETITNADLNGDVCADLVTAGIGPDSKDPQPTTIFGSTSGLDLTTARKLKVPQSDRPADSKDLLYISAIGIRHHGISQVVVSGYFTAPPVFEEPGKVTGDWFLDTFTLDAAGVAGSPVVWLQNSAEVNVAGMNLAGSGATVVVGAPAMSVNGRADAGGVLIFGADASDPTRLTYRRTITQNSAGVPGTAERGDRFGADVSIRDGRLAIGVPGESIGRARETGSVQPIRWYEGTNTYTAYRSIQQSTRGVPGSNENEDSFGFRVLVTRGLTAVGSYDIAISATERLGRVYWAGTVTVAHFTKAIYRAYSQNTKGLPGTAEAGDLFGSTLGSLPGKKGIDTLLIGAPNDHYKTGGSGYVVRSDGRKLSSKTKWASVAMPAKAGVLYFDWGKTFGS